MDGEGPWFLHMRGFVQFHVIARLWEEVDRLKCGGLQVRRFSSLEEVEVWRV